MRRLRSPDGEFRLGKALPEEMLRCAFLTSYRGSRCQRRLWSSFGPVVAKEVVMMLQGYNVPALAVEVSHWPVHLRWESGRFSLN